MTTFYTRIVTSTSCLLTYLKIKKIEVGKLSQPTHPPTHPPITIKLFRKSKKADIDAQFELKKIGQKCTALMKKFSTKKKHNFSRNWWVGCDILPPSIFFIFRYVNKHNVLVTNLVSKLVKRF